MPFSLLLSHQKNYRNTLEASALIDGGVLWQSAALSPTCAKSAHPRHLWDSPEKTALSNSREAPHDLTRPDIKRETLPVVALRVQIPDALTACRIGDVAA